MRRRYVRCLTGKETSVRQLEEVAGDSWKGVAGGARVGGAKREE